MKKVSSYTPSTKIIAMPQNVHSAQKV